ncbi:ATP-binding protein [Kitasatospora sp. NPDC059599]|uniref:ATP-binding protein n=1 Tax=Kitasatospora sp. NPDC059599 TaxID=3346880 RepID=UPI0036AB39E4
MTSSDDLVDPVRFFAERLQELRENAAEPLRLDDLANAASAILSTEARRAGLPTVRTVSKQRISAWSRGDDVPRSFGVLRAVLTVMFKAPPRDGATPTTGLYNTRRWKQWWEEAQRKRSSRSPTAVAMPAPSTAAMHTLRADVADFTGRQDYLEEICEFLPSADLDAPGPAVIVIDGMGGVGKTCLAFHAAHQLSSRYPDVQWEADLHGFDPGGQEPTDPSEVLSDLLNLAGVAPEAIPSTFDARMARYRDLLSGQRVLIVLDNAISEDQVRPLVPSSSNSLVLVTSRNKLAGLEGARHINLKAFSESDALDLFARLIGSKRFQGDTRAAKRICGLTGHLAIAITIAAGYLQSHPAWTLAAYADELRDENRRLRALSAGDRIVSSVFSLSYRPLPASAQRVFRLLSLHPGDGATAYSTAALADLDIIEAEETLEYLFTVNLLHQLTPGRYGLHDLIRSYAHSRLQYEDSENERSLAVARVVSWYLHTAHRAARLLAPGLRPVDISTVPIPRHQLTLSDDQQAMSWCDTERRTLAACVSAAEFYDLHALTWQLACSLFTFYDLRKYWDDWIEGHHHALAAAIKLGDSKAQALSLVNLASAYWQKRDTAKAISCCQRAVPLCRTTHDDYMTARALNNLGLAHWQARRFREAINYFKKAIPLRRAAGDRCGEGITLNNLGLAYSEVGRFHKAINCYMRAIPLERETRERQCEGHTLNNLGAAHLAIGNIDLAFTYLHQALSLRRQIGDRWGPAETLEELGRAFYMNEDEEAARASWIESASIFDELGDSQADQVRLRLQELD